MEIAIFLVGLGFTVFGLLMVWDTNKFKKHAVASSGVVVALEVKKSRSRNSGNMDMYAPVVQYEMDGEKHQFTARVSSSSISHQIGDPLSILVDKTDPSHARLAKSAMDVIAYILAVVGIGMMVGFFFLFDYSPTSIAIAGFVVAVAIAKLMIGLRRKGMCSIEDLKAAIDKTKQQGIQPSKNTQHKKSAKIITDQSALNRHLQQKGTKIPKWFFSVFLLVGLAMSIGGMYLTQQRAEFLHSALAVQGQVVSFNSKTSTSNGNTSTTYYPLVLFRPADSSVDVQFEHEMGSSSPSYSRGQSVTVLYSPTDHSEAIIDEAWMNWLGPIMLLTFGVVFVLASFNMKRMQKKFEKQQQKLSLDI